MCTNHKKYDLSDSAGPFYSALFLSSCKPKFKSKIAQFLASQRHLATKIAPDLAGNITPTATVLAFQAVRT